MDRTIRIKIKTSQDGNRCSINCRGDNGGAKCGIFGKSREYDMQKESEKRLTICKKSEAKEKK
jgi:hypothetical protein